MANSGSSGNRRPTLRKGASAIYCWCPADNWADTFSRLQPQTTPAGRGLLNAEHVFHRTAYRGNWKFATHTSSKKARGEFLRAARVHAHPINKFICGANAFKVLPVSERCLQENSSGPRLLVHVLGKVMGIRWERFSNEDLASNKGPLSSP